MNGIDSVLDSYFDAWNRAFQSKNDTEIRAFLSKEFKGHFGRSEMTEAYTYDADYEIVPILNMYTTAEKSFEVLSSAKRNSDREIVVIGNEQNLIDGELSKAKSMMIWRNENNEWKLLREYIELEK
ncbi:DUF4440 domain-containing protein [Alkalihalobacillus sp. AL-G]|uniref:DUF4440 domain-containing protein n=1 Tax=Alkalihalobacillus sp. AL-G TaxID=2926399 RepID=UPI002729887E|nr:DUF4440 domain-containing protein [Alkalihalobacillus sp. AL-G]WLD94722.1 DUF4440 domain-containing protein [Alkalihalobacillus sp. AL-G]